MYKCMIIFVGIGSSIRGGRGGGMTQRRGNSNAGNYNPNINVTGNDIQQGKKLFFNESIT